MKLNKKAQLCFVEPESNRNLFWLWFVDDLSEAHGDDWNDGYWEHNASQPLNEEAFTVPVDLNVEGSYHWFEYPPDTASVDTINAGAHAWLYSVINGRDVAFRAGMTLKEINDLVIEIGGKIYWPSEQTPIVPKMSKTEFMRKVVQLYQGFINVTYEVLLYMDEGQVIPHNLVYQLKQLNLEASQFWHQNYNRRWNLT
jgi:hypothetical protein